MLLFNYKINFIYFVLLVGDNLDDIYVLVKTTKEESICNPIKNC